MSGPSETVKPLVAALEGSKGMTGYNKAPEGVVRPSGQGGAGALLTILSAAELRGAGERFPYYRELLHSLGSIRYCKAELFKSCILGTLRVPQKSAQRAPLMSFGFYLTEGSLYFIEDTGDLKKWVDKQLNMLQEPQSPDQLLLQLMERMIENDVLYLSHLEKEAEELEDTLNRGLPKDFFSVLTRHRQKLSEFNAYYEQLTAIGELLRSQAGLLSLGSTDGWERYALRTARLQNHVQLLRENVLQLRELYQSQQDARQNKIMGILTVITTLFLPLTLLTGWYGMNFAYMPEFHWKYGYPMVAGAAIVIVVIEIIYFKRKKFF